MQLPQLEPDWHGDLGRVLPPEEVEVVKASITPIDKVVSRCCKTERDNNLWRLGRV